MTTERLKRINELAAIAKQRNLTLEELKERDALRKEYLAAVRANIRGQLDNVLLVDKDGTKTPLKRKK